MKVLICAGGTGGGIYPALAAAAELKERGVAASDLLWVGVAGEMEEILVPRAGIRLEKIVGGAIAGVSRLQQLKNGLKLLWSIWLSFRIMGNFRPDVVFLTGGYMAVPVGFAARIRRIPSVMYLPDLEPGSALKTISRTVGTVTATFAASAEYFPQGKRVVETGYPVRQALVDAAEQPKTAAIKTFDFELDVPILFVFGGSRGAKSINDALMAILPDLLKKMQVIHVSGTLTWPEVEAFAQTLPEDLKTNYRPFPYLHEEMGMAFRAADLVIARAGASMMGECPLFGVPAILVPYPYAWRYQKVNADFLVTRGAGVRLDDEKLGSDLLKTIDQLIEGHQLEEMKKAAKSLYVSGAAGKIAKVIMEVGGV
ncbi:MAG: glycosyltransferase [Anaerolineae bacterium]